MKRLTNAAEVWAWLDEHPPKVTAADRKAAADFRAANPRKKKSLYGDPEWIAYQRTFAKTKNVQVKAGLWKEQQKAKPKLSDAETAVRRKGGAARVVQRRVEKAAQYKHDTARIVDAVNALERKTGLNAGYFRARGLARLVKLADLAAELGMSERTLRRRLALIKRFP